MTLVHLALVLAFWFCVYMGGTPRSKGLGAAPIHASIYQRSGRPSSIEAAFGRLNHDSIGPPKRQSAAQSTPLDAPCVRASRRRKQDTLHAATMARGHVGSLRALMLAQARFQMTMRARTHALPGLLESVPSAARPPPHPAVIASSTACLLRIDLRGSVGRSVAGMARGFVFWDRGYPQQTKTALATFAMYLRTPNPPTAQHPTAAHAAVLRSRGALGGERQQREQQQ